jgi:hypothetical protein
MKKQETLTEEKNRMVADWDYYQKPNGEIDTMVNRRTLTFLYGSQASFVLGYMRKIHNVQLLPIRALA